MASDIEINDEVKDLELKITVTNKGKRLSGIDVNLTLMISSRIFGDI